MKKQISKYFILAFLAGLVIFQTSCRKDLLEQVPTVDLGASQFWKTDADAEYALSGLYASIRPVFDRDYYMDGHGEYVRARGESTEDDNLESGAAYDDGSFDPSGYAGNWNNMYRYLYGGINHANYVIENVEKMIAGGNNSEKLEIIIGEARLLRGLSYFKLIAMWGDVPYIDKVINDNSEVATLPRTPIAEVKDAILADYTYAFEKLPAQASAIGRASKAAALSLRGKMNLYWGSWKKNGWPELEGFVQDQSEATLAFTAAAADFKSVINDFGLTLYMNGEPGEIDQLGKAEKLPNYYHLFTPKANGNPEMIMVFTHGGTGTGQSESLMRDFAGRSVQFSQCWVSPRFELADRYQKLSTGDFAVPLKGMNPTTNLAARTTLNSAVNPASYADRDYRMKASLMWDYETCVGLANLQATGWVPFIYNVWDSKVTIDGIQYTSYNTNGTNSGYIFRKFVRNYPGQDRNEGDFNWPVVRLADVYLMYAEASNEVSGPLADAIEVVNKVRHRGNLPELGPDKIADRQSFFNAIEQERIVELVGEGQRGFDIRRWRSIEKIWGAPGSAGVWRRDTWGVNKQRYYQNTNERVYAQNYIFRIPESERNRNPNLTQNIPWR
jgi:starch-binding outer membrane protein, SusD/RagB family